MKVTDEMVDRFLSWRLPITAMPDACVMDRSHDRMGTHVLSFTEAKAMLEHVLAGCDESKSWGWRPVPAPRMAATQRLEWGVNSVYTYVQTPSGERGRCFELDLPPLPTEGTKPGGEIPEAPYCDCPGWCLSKDRPKPVRCQGFQLPEGAENG